MLDDFEVDHLRRAPIRIHVVIAVAAAETRPLSGAKGFVILTIDTATRAEVRLRESHVCLGCALLAKDTRRRLALVYQLLQVNLCIDQSSARYRVISELVHQFVELGSALVVRREVGLQGRGRRD